MRRTSLEDKDKKERRVEAAVDAQVFVVDGGWMKKRKNGVKVE